MEILNRETITTPQSKFVEVKDKIVINTNVYDSQSMTQIPYSFYINNVLNKDHNRITTSKVSLNRNTLGDTTNSAAAYSPFDFNTNHSIQDEFDPKYTYVLYYLAITGGGARLEKVLSESDSVKSTGLICNNPGGVNSAMKYLGQDANYLYILALDWVWYSTPTSVWYKAATAHKIRKSDMVNEKTTALGTWRDIGAIIYQDSDYIFISHLLHSATDYTMTRIKKIDLTFTTKLMKKISTTNIYRSEQFANLHKEGNLSVCFSTCLVSATTTVSPGITRAKMDFTDSVKKGSTNHDWLTSPHSPCTVSWGAFTQEKADFDRLSINGNENSIAFITKAGDKTYVSFYFYFTAYTTLKVDTGIYTFQVINSDELKYVSRLQLDGLERTPLFIGAGTDSISEIYIPSDIAVYYTKFNPVSEAFEVINTKFITAGSIGLDSLNRVWAIDETTKQLYMFDETLVERVNIAFQNTKVDYIGADIANNLIVNCMNNLNKKIAYDIELTLVGNAVFTGDAKKITVKTLVDADLQVPITIKGPGQISVYPKVIL
jgi:hypothetical protein